MERKKWQTSIILTHITKKELNQIQGILQAQEGRSISRSKVIELGLRRLANDLNISLDN